MLPWIIFTASVTAAILNVWKNKVCFVIWTCTNISWCVHNLTLPKPEIAQACSYAVFTGFAIVGYFKWNREDKNESN